MIISFKELFWVLVAICTSSLFFASTPLSLSGAAQSAQKAEKIASQNAFVLSLVKKVDETHAQLPKTQAIKMPVMSKKQVEVPKKTAALPVATATTATNPKPIVAPALPSIEEQNQLVRKALVNILCTTKTGGALRPISGSGVIVDPRGIILTNAHVAQFFLLRDYLVPNFVQCVIRTGSPAEPAYYADLFYLPPVWVEKNAENIAQEVGLGTGEHDYAFLAIKRTVSGAPLPENFAYLQSDYAFDVAPLNYPVLLAGYPAELVGNILTARDLHAITSASTISQAFFFENGKPEQIDLLTLAPNILAQAGSSGGAVVSRINTSLLALLVTTSSGTTTASKMLNAVNLSHIHRSLLSLTGKTYPEMLLGDIDAKIQNFNGTLFVPLRDKLVAAINSN